jgi:acyl transferase domain-containing protein/acyl carrier protein
MPKTTDFDIAIVGMAGRFPGAPDVDAFWRDLAAGCESITRLSDQEILDAGVPASYLTDPNYVKAAPILEGPGLFDAGFFGFSPMEARTMDPQHRILLELAHEALEHAGYDAERYPGRIGVFTGAALNTYFTNVGLNRRLVEEYIPTLIGNDKDFLSTRISYKLNLKGPSITVQTACSTSMVAVHLACQSLLGEETDMALAGAISVRVPHRAGYFCDGGGVVSRDGHVRAFDAKANGTVFGSGGGILVLKRLADALADGDTIHAVIKGSAVNNDGSAKAGFTAPSVNSQADAVVEALANAGVEADSIGYVEAHGSGTPVGDPIEVRALTKAFRTSTQRAGYCAIGSVKTNVGHLDAAAAVAGIIKTVLALEHRQLPPSLHFTEANPEIDFPATPFYVNTALREWTGDGPRRAGVMSTGMGGTNAHVVLEEAPERVASSEARPPHLLIVSAKTAPALDQATQRLREFLSTHDSVNMSDVAYTLQIGRKAFPHRRCVVCVDRADAITALGPEGAKRVVSGRTDEARRPVILLLPGIGDHYVGMAHDLYETWPVFRQAVDRCAQVLEPHLGIDIRRVIYPQGRSWRPAGKAKGIDLKKMLGRSPEAAGDPEARNLNQTRLAHPALFTIEYATTRLWHSLGIVPDAIVGHSMGEYVAACLAGVMSLDDALRLIATRARLVDALPQGAMLAVTLPEDELLPLLPAELSISLINGPRLCVVAGPVAAVAGFERLLNAKNIICRHVQNGHAFHSRMLDPIVPAFEEAVRQVRLAEPTIPYISNVTGTWIERSEAVSPAYWATHATRTARFSDALHELWRFKDPVLLEAGPGRTLGVLAMQHPDRRDGREPVVLSSIRHDYENQSDGESLWQAIGRLWVSGADIAWDRVPSSEGRRRVPLPTYPFERQLHWLEPVRVAEAAQATVVAIHKQPDPAKWLYVPSWKRVLPRAVGRLDEALRSEPAATWLAFADDSGLASAVMNRVRAAGHDVVTVRAGSEFRQEDPRSFSIDPANAQHYDALINALRTSEMLPDRIVHAWSVTRPAGRSDEDRFAEGQARGFYSLLFLARALAAHHAQREIRLSVLSSNVHEVSGTEALCPERATLLGPSMAIGQEYPNLRVTCIDVDEPVRTGTPEGAADLVLGELLESDAHLFVAHRTGRRWVQTYEPVDRADAGRRRSTLRAGGVYMITGGLGEIGTALSAYLAERYHARLVLVGRSALPARESWDTWIESHATDDPIGARIGAIKRIEGLGGEVLYVNANVADARAMRSVVAQAEQRFGALHGVIHGAGIVGDYREIKDSDPDGCEAHFRAKAHGVHVLACVLDGKSLDFCLLMSSLTSVLGGIGHAAYAASNLYLDAFARRHNRASMVPWLSVNWDVWRLHDDAAAASGLGATLKDLGMSGPEAMAMLETVLALGPAGQLVVSTGDLGARIDQWIKLESLNPEGAAPAPASVQRPSLQTAFQAPLDETERQVARIWQDALGIEAVGSDDSFADLGGHSLLAVRIVVELRKAFQIDLPIRALFDAPTVAELSRYIKEHIVAEIEALTDEEARRLVSNE